jgi:hypothetical protein
MRLTKKRTGANLERVARTAGEKVREISERVSPKLKKAARIAREKFRQTEQKIEQKVRESADRATASLRSDQRLFVIGRIAARDVCVPNGTLLVARGQRITAPVAAEAERHGVLDELYRAAGGSLAREFGHAAKNLLSATGERIGKGATHATETADRLWKDVRGKNRAGAGVPLPPMRKTMTRKSTRP